MIEFRTGVDKLCFQGETENIFGFVDHVSVALTLMCVAYKLLQTISKQMHKMIYHDKDRQLSGSCGSDTV